MDYFFDAFKKYADFTGRATRTEYWMFIMFYVIIYLVLAAIDAFFQTVILTLILTIVLFVPSISIAARRLHDTGRSGWWQLIALIPLIGIIVLIVLLIIDSTDANEYGSNPKQA